MLEGLTRTIIFTISFITFALTTSDLRESVQTKMPGLFDKSLGVLFGFFKTLLIFGVIYSLYFNIQSMALGKDLQVKEPKWLTEAKSYSLVKFSGETVDPLVRKFFESISGNFDRLIPEHNLDKKIDEIIDEQPLDIQDLEGAVEDSGYSKKDIEKMNHLIDIIDK